MLSSSTTWRSPRIRLADITPAVLRFPDGRQHRGKLDTLSLTGGLLSMPAMLDRGLQLKLLFLTRRGPVLSAIETLAPVSATQQPFRFIEIEQDDERRLRATVQSTLSVAEEAWIGRYRAAVLRQNTSQRHFVRLVFRFITSPLS